MLLLLKFSRFFPPHLILYIFFLQLLLHIPRKTLKNPSEHRKITELLDMKLVLFQPSWKPVYSKGWEIFWENGAQSFNISSKLVHLFVFSCFLIMFSASSGCCFCPWFCLLFLVLGFPPFSWKIFVGKAVFGNIDLAFGFEPYGS